MANHRAKQVGTTKYYSIEKQSELSTDTGTAIVWEKVNNYSLDEIDSELLGIEDNISNINKRKTEITEFKNLILSKSLIK